MAWNLEGTVLVACNCDYGCPCNYNALPTTGKCEGGWMWIVDKGRSGDVSLDGLLVTWMRPGFPILVVIYRAHITGGALQVAPDEASEARFFARAELPPLEEIAWPSAAHGLEAWRAYEPPRP